MATKKLTNADKFADRARPAQCNTCSHFHPKTTTCEAYPLGIPVVILTNQVDHRKPLPGDNGVQWERAKNAAYKYHPLDKKFKFEEELD